MNVSQALSVIFFFIVSLISFSVWAFAAPLFPNEPAMYAGCAIVFLGLGGMALLPACGLSGKAALQFCLSFAVAYLAYAFIWSITWFSIPTTFGEVLGSSTGSVAFSAILLRWNRLKISLLVATSVLFLFHTIGYYLGGFAYQAIQGRGPLGFELNLSAESIRLLARLSWGAGYGLGVGLGISKILYLSHQSLAKPSTQI
ncbi:MAG: hypothetical protein P1U81_08105 [Verrucomicrobiales bacterium]|nr:hypothetical protein [Verrucomicrobiales bacterium]